MRTGRTRYYLPKEEIKGYNVMIDDQNFFDQPLKIDIRTNESIRKNATGKEDVYTAGCLLDYLHFEEHYKQIEANNKH